MGTFDVSILELGDGVFEVKSTNGDSKLGGDDFDNAIVTWLADSFIKEYAIDLRKDPAAAQRLREAAEKAKVELSSTTSTEINLPYIIPVDGIPKHLVKTLSRALFEQLTDDLTQRTLEPCKKAMKDAGMTVSDIDEVILVGGSTRMPVIQKLVEDFFKKVPSKGVNPDEVVAMGAAIQGAVLSGDADGILLLDVTPLSLGIETMGGIMTKLIDANTTIPISKSETFTTAADNQASVEVHVLQGERPQARYNKTLGKFHLDGLPPARKNTPQIEVKFDIDANGILSVTALDKATNKKQQIRIEAASGLSDSEIEQMKKEASENEDSDKKFKEALDLKNKAENLIFSTEKFLETDNLPTDENEIKSIQESIADLKQTLSADFDSEVVEAKMKTLSDSINVLAEKMYKQNEQTTDEPHPNDSEKVADATDINFDTVE